MFKILNAGKNKYFIYLLLLSIIPTIITRQLSPSVVLNFLYTQDSEITLDDKTRIDKTNYFNQDFNSYYNFVKNTSKAPEQYIIDKFKEKDLVIISENHWLKSHTNFVENLVEPLVKYGIHDFAFEFSTSQSQELINEFLNKSEPDFNLLYESFSEDSDLFGWPFSGYIKVFLKLHKINQELKKQGSKLYIHLVNAPLRVNYKREGWFRDKHMSIKLEELLKKGKKVLFYCGSTHGITNLTSKKSNKKFTLVGTILNEKFKNKVFSVKLHSLASDIENKKIVLKPIADGLFEQILEKYKTRAGFDLVSSPFDKISSKSLNELFSNSSIDKNNITDVWQGYIFPTEYLDRKFCGVEEDMFYKGYINRKLMRDNFVLGIASYTFFSQKQLIEACKLYKIKDSYGHFIRE